MEDLDLNQAPAEKPEKQAKAKAEKPAAPAWSKYLKSSTPYGYTDPESKIHFSPVVPVRIDAEPKKGSWLESQMKAGLIVEA